MIVFRKRLIIWLIRAYIKKWGKVIVFSFIIGLVLFFTLLFTSKYFIHTPLLHKRVTYGMVGAYTVDTLPPEVLGKLSHGLTTVDNSGQVKPDVAASWEIRNNGKTYIFHLKKGLHFVNGDEVTANRIHYNFSDVTVNRPDPYTIVFHLKYQYSPFLVTVSQPIFQKNFIGVGNYRIEKSSLNGSFIQSLTIGSIKNAFDSESYQFYPTENALKLGFIMGEVTDALGLDSQTFKNQKISSYPGVTVRRNVDYSQLVTLFYDTEDSVLSDKKIRDSLTYSLPDTFSEGERSYVSYPKSSLYFNKDYLDPRQDDTHARLLLESATVGTHSALPVLTLKTFPRYANVAKIIQHAWSKIGVKIKIENVDHVPPHFQIFLGDFNVPKDPDQYVLWHSGQTTNIANYKNLRIDKLLEDGRKITSTAKRQSIYQEFQKYLLDDSPASFLYFPYSYEISR